MENVSADINAHVPSWSWMAYNGGIDYIDPPYRYVTWETSGLIHPWTRGDYTDPDINESVAIVAVARGFNIEGCDPQEVDIAYDTTQGSEEKRVQCVIVAKLDAGSSDLDRLHYILLVVPMQDECEDERRVKCK
jgi:hypothetical protein